MLSTTHLNLHIFIPAQETLGLVLVGLAKLVSLSLDIFFGLGGQEYIQFLLSYPPEVVMPIITPRDNYTRLCNSQKVKK